MEDQDQETTHLVAQPTRPLFYGTRPTSVQLQPHWDDIVMPLRFQSRENHLTTRVSNILPDSPERATNLATLPVELLLDITQYLDTDDLHCLRQCSQTLNTRLKETHLNALFQTREVYFTYASLDNLIKVSLHPSGVNKRVRRLRFNLVPPTLAFKSPSAVPDDLSEEMKADPELAYLILQMKQHSAASRCSAIHLPDTIKKSLSRAFLNLSNIEIIEFNADAGPLKRDVMCVHHPFLNLKPGREAVRRFLHWVFVVESLSSENTVRPRSYMFHTVLSVVMAYHLNIKEIICDTEDMQTPITWYKALLNARIFHSLHGVRRLDIPIDIGSWAFPPSGDYHSVDMYTDVHPAFEWVNSIGDCIEELLVSQHPKNPYLRSSNVYAEDKAPPLHSLVFLGGLYFPKLWSLKLYSIILERQHLLEFLANHTGVRVLLFENCWLKNPRSDWLEVLEFAKSGLPKLRSFELNSFQIAMLPEAAVFRPPTLRVAGSWTGVSIPCEIFSHFSRRKLSGNRREVHLKKICDVDLKVELERNLEPLAFWMEISNGYRGCIDEDL